MSSRIRYLLAILGAGVFTLAAAPLTKAQTVRPPMAVPAPTVVPKACENQEVLRACPRTCYRLCLNTSVAGQNSPLGQVCNELSVARVSSLRDQPTCRGIIIDPTAPEPPRQTLQECLKTAASGIGLLDLTKKIQSPELRALISARFGNPPPPGCAPLPASLRAMYKCVGIEAGQLQEGYKSLAGQSGSMAADKKCDRPLPEYEQAYTNLVGLKQRADYISQYSTGTLAACIKQWTDWLETMGQPQLKKDQEPKNEQDPKNDQEPKNDLKREAVVAEVVKDVISNHQKDMEGVVDMQTAAQQTIKSINDALANTEGSVIRRLLTCSN